ncbi:undecaprenyl-diphosphatase [Jatrophihabitans endophyticus]|uniref:Undecaprenyl-diphosphatase n=1 Tax=Jatrophihabitans endophyticus TaxID=1206085 RepID=A0A1M5DDM9_9ACTN|nr:undecaprenyl-diphosphatase [Jatrophihabitans endophyticus]
MRLGRWDRRLLVAAARRRTPLRDRVMTTASTLANRSLLWLAVAGALSATGRRRPRTAAASGLLGIGVAATLVNGPLKFAWRRDRPPTDVAPLLPLPRTFSFPSGHAASALAFATGVTAALPAAGAAVVPVAGTVAYSRVHTGVHYPSDVAVGAAVGIGAGVLAARVVDRVRESSVHHPDAPDPAVPIPRQAVLLASPHAGSAEDLDVARAGLAAAGLTVVRTFDVGEVDELARHVDAALASGEEPPLVVAAGGDGTVGLAAGVVAGTAAVLFPLPLGTSNDVARSLGIPPDAAQAAAAVGGYRVCEVDAGRVDLAGRGALTFLNATTVGVNVAFADLATEKTVRDRFGGLTYPIAAARAVRAYRPFRCTVEHDGRERTFDVVHLSVSNAPVFGGLLGFRVPGADLTDGLLDVIVVERLSVGRLVLAVADAAVGRHRPVGRVHTLRVRSLRVACDSDQDVAVDGEVVGGLPVEFTVLPRAVRVACPRG